MEFLKGKKTYFVAAAIGLCVVAKYLGYMDEKTFDMLTVLLTGGGLATLRAAK